MTQIIRTFVSAMLSTDLSNMFSASISVEGGGTQGGSSGLVQIIHVIPVTHFNEKEYAYKQINHITQKQNEGHVHLHTHAYLFGMVHF